MGRGRRPRIPSSVRGGGLRVPVPEEPAGQPGDTRRSEGAARPVAMGAPRPALLPVLLLLLLQAVAGAGAREWGGPACGPRGPGSREEGLGGRGPGPAVARPRTTQWGAGTAQAGERVLQNLLLV